MKIREVPNERIGRPVSPIVAELQTIRPQEPDENAPGTYTYVMPIVSGVVGTLNPKALPLSAMTASDIRVEFTLAQLEDATQTTEGVNNWTASNFEIQADILQLDPASEAMVVAASGGQFSVNTQSYSEATSVVAAATNSASVLLPFRYSSLKSIILGHYCRSLKR